MKPPRFAYLRAESLDEALEALCEYGEEAKVIAGGQSLVPLMNMRLARPTVLVDINRIPQLDGIDIDGLLTIGAVARQETVRRSAEVRAFAPVLAEALSHVGYPAIRSRGTFGGSAAHADPAAEIPALLLLLDAELVVRGRDGERVIAAPDFFKTFFTTALAPEEILTRVRIPRPPTGVRWSFLEVSRRQGDFALVGVAAAVATQGDGTVSTARIALFGVADTPLRAEAAEQLLTGRRLDDDRVHEETARAAASSVRAREDVHASAGYRTIVTETLVRRALAAMTAQGGTG